MTTNTLNWKKIRRDCHEAGKQISTEVLAALEKRMDEKLRRIILVSRKKRITMDDVELTHKL